MKKLATALSLSALILVFAASAALAQAYPPQPGPAVEVDITIVTPNKVIKIDGTNWGPGTIVEITDRESATNGDNDNDTESAAQSLAVATVAADGSFSADVAVPEGSSGNFEVVGVDEEGVSQARPLHLSVAADEAQAASQVDATPAVSMLTPGNGALALLVVGGALALFFGPIRRRSTSS